MTYNGSSSFKRLDHGWRDFSIDNNLKAGDACVFQLIDTKDVVQFKVQILRGDLPSDFFASSEKGTTSQQEKEEPLLPTTESTSEECKSSNQKRRSYFFRSNEKRGGTSVAPILIE